MNLAQRSDSPESWYLKSNFISTAGLPHSGGIFWPNMGKSRKGQKSLVCQPRTWPSIAIKKLKISENILVWKHSDVKPLETSILSKPTLCPGIHHTASPLGRSWGPLMKGRHRRNLWQARDGAKGVPACFKLGWKGAECFIMKVWICYNVGQWKHHGWTLCGYPFTCHSTRLHQGLLGVLWNSGETWETFQTFSKCARLLQLLNVKTHFNFPAIIMGNCLIWSFMLPVFWIWPGYRLET